MSAKATGTPWGIEAVSDAVRIISYVSSSDGLSRKPGGKKIILARLCPPQLSEDETWANARLMHAAPELLKACKLARAVAQDQVDELASIAGADSALEEAKSRLYTFDHAIAKAEGRTTPPGRTQQSPPEAK